MSNGIRHGICECGEEAELLPSRVQRRDGGARGRAASRWPAEPVVPVTEDLTARLCGPAADRQGAERDGGEVRDLGVAVAQVEELRRYREVGGARGENAVVARRIPMGSMGWTASLAGQHADGTGRATHRGSSGMFAGTEGGVRGAVRRRDRRGDRFRRVRSRREPCGKPLGALRSHVDGCGPHGYERQHGRSVPLGSEQVQLGKGCLRGRRRGHRDRTTPQAGGGSAEVGHRALLGSRLAGALRNAEPTDAALLGGKRR